MTGRIALLALFALTPGGLFTGARAADELTEKQTKKLQGTWEIIAQEVDGKKMPKSDFESTRVVFSGATFKTEAHGKVLAEGSWKFVKEEGKVFEVDEVTASNASNVEGTTPAIYEWVDENTFRWCQAVDGKKRPTKFTAEKGSHQSLIEYRRVKK